MNNPEEISEDNVVNKTSVDDGPPSMKKQTGSSNASTNIFEQGQQNDTTQGPQPFDIICDGLRSDLSKLATSELPEIDNSIKMVPSAAESTAVIEPATTTGINETENMQQLTTLADIDTFSTPNSSESSKNDNKFESVTSIDKDSKNSKSEADKTPRKKAKKRKSSVSGNRYDNEISQTQEILITSCINRVHKNVEENLDKKNKISHKINENPTNISTRIPANHPDTSLNNSHVAHNFEMTSPNTIRIDHPNVNVVNKTVPSAPAQNKNRPINAPMALNTQAPSATLNMPANPAYSVNDNTSSPIYRELPNPRIHNNNLNHDAVPNNLNLNNDVNPPQNVGNNIHINPNIIHLTNQPDTVVNNTNPYFVNNFGNENEPTCPVSPNKMFPIPGINPRCYMNNYQQHIRNTIPPDITNLPPRNIINGALTHIPKGPQPSIHNGRRSYITNVAQPHMTNDHPPHIINSPPPHIINGPPPHIIYGPPPHIINWLPPHIIYGPPPHIIHWLPPHIINGYPPYFINGHHRNMPNGPTTNFRNVHASNIPSRYYSTNGPR